MLEPASDDPGNTQLPGERTRDHLVTEGERSIPFPSVVFQSIEKGLSPDDREPGELLEVGRDGLGDADADPVVVRPSRDVGEREDRNRVRPEIARLRKDGLALRGALCVGDRAKRGKPCPAQQRRELRGQTR